MVRPYEILLTLLSLLAAWGMSSCSGGDEPPRPNREDTGNIMSFRFTIHTADVTESRAPGVWEEDAVNAAERILNTKDIRVLLFDQGGTLLKSIQPSAVSYSEGTGAGDGYYMMNVSFAHEYFDKFEASQNVPFQVVIQANLKGAGGDYMSYSPGTTRIGSLNESFRLPSDYYPTTERGIPMYGYGSFNVKKELLSNTLNVYEAGEIDMIRGLCKIEIYENIANATTGPDGLKYPHVTGIEMVSWNDHGYLTPRYADYATGLRYANIYPAPPTAQAQEATATDGLYRLYCPEAAVSDVKFRVEAILSPGAGNSYFETSLEPFAAEIGKELIRNHIYRFDINALNTVASLSAEVSDWHVQTNEFELKDIVSIEPDGFLQWEYDPADFAVSTETYNDMQEEQLSILNGTTKYATGRFHIISPKGATWKAYFIPGENGVDAFEFVDADDGGQVIDGSEKVYAEGLVGEKATIHIRGKGPADSYRHWAELVIEVHTVDGTILHAPLTPRMSSRFIVYRENKI